VKKGESALGLLLVRHVLAKSLYASRTRVLQQTLELQDPIARTRRFRECRIARRTPDLHGPVRLQGNDPADLHDTFPFQDQIGSTVLERLVLHNAPHTRVTVNIRMSGTLFVAGLQHPHHETFRAGQRVFQQCLVASLEYVERKKGVREEYDVGKRKEAELCGDWIHLDSDSRGCENLHRFHSQTNPSA
jgi:hypothetical protein